MLSCAGYLPRNDVPVPGLSFCWQRDVQRRRRDVARVVQRGMVVGEPSSLGSHPKPFRRIPPKRMKTSQTTLDRVSKMKFASVYPRYVAKAERKGRQKSEVDAIIRWLTGYSQKQVEAQTEKGVDFATFFAEAPRLNPSRTFIKGVVCGVRVEAIEEPLMREVRYLDKLVDELAQGKAIEKILRS